MFLDTWNRLKDTLVFAQTQLALSSIILTLPEAVPRAAQPYEKFVAIIGATSTTGNQAVAQQGEYRERDASLVFPLDIYSEPVTATYDVKMITNILTVMDAIVDTFNERPKLEDANWKGMKHLDPKTPVLLTGITYNIQPYPRTSKDNRHHFGAVINVPYIWSCPAKQT